MPIYNPGDYNGNEENGNATVIPVHAYISTNATELIDDQGVPTGVLGGYVPFTVRFYAWDTPGTVPAGNISSGTSAIFSVTNAAGVIPTTITTAIPTWQWEHTFTEASPTPYQVNLTTIGGTRTAQASINILARPSLPSGSARLIIRALKVEALAETYSTISTEGDQI